MNNQQLALSVLNEKFSIAQLPPNVSVPMWVRNSQFYAITRTDEELSIVCETIHVPEGVKSESGWRAIKLHGHFEFSLTGILSNLLNPLAAEKISIFVISTFNTDYVLVKDAQLENAVAVLKANGYQFED